jgi:coenzyme F420-dependent glucose-6-phosphate dehydrogenase
MLELGFSLSSEEHAPLALVRQAARAEEAGFGFALISDHYHPWLDQQGQSPFVWTTLGGIAQATGRLRLGTGVTCPLIRVHPAIVAQAAASTQAIFEGRFFLGLGTGEYLNEHIFGDPWPRISIRQEMLEEAIKLIRHLWEGGLKSFEGDYYQVDRARVYTLPEPLPPIYVAAVGKSSAELAGAAADGLISIAPQASMVQSFDSAGGAGKPRYGQMTVCWAETEEAAVETVLEWWPIVAIGGSLTSELAIPSYFEAAAKNVRPEDVKAAIPVGPDPERHLDRLREYALAGFDHVYIHQVGPDQEGFIRFCEREILPQAGRL